jgi:16S rRNA (guanine966-N2)-methyltransferase
MSALGGAIMDARVLDLFAGSGALGLECLSRGAREAVFVERARGAVKVLRANVAELGAQEQVRIVVADAITYASRLEAGAFDLALADPPYDRGHAAQLLELYRDVPFARELWVEHRSSEVIPSLEGLRSRRYGDTTISIIESSQ